MSTSRGRINFINFVDKSEYRIPDTNEYVKRYLYRIIHIKPNFNRLKTRPKIKIYITKVCCEASTLI